jgi:hypothetical protein
MNNNLNNKKISSKISLPFLKVNIERSSDLNNISNKLENSKTLINSQTDKLLIAGFEGDEEDFKQCYKKMEPIKKKKITNIKQKKLNKLLVKDDYLGPIKLTKIKEFNMTLRHKNKLLEKINQFKTLRNNSNRQFNKYYKKNKDLINSIINNNNSSKFNNITNGVVNLNSSENGNNFIYYNNSSINNAFNYSTTNNFYNNSLNSLKGSYYFYNKNNSQFRSQRTLKNKSINQKNFVTLRDILTHTSHSINDINNRLKKYIRKNKDIYTISYSEDKDKKPKLIKINKRNNKSNLSDVLDSLKKKHKEQILKQIKSDEGINSQNIWIKRSTANLVSFGKAFLYLADDLFYREHKRIISKYPEIEKDADLPVIEKNNINLIKKIHKLKMEQNSRLIKDLNYNNIVRVNELNKRIKNKSN